jgi:hypothetical protein
LRLLEGQFRIFQKRSRARRDANLKVVAWLRSLDTSEYGDSIAQAGKVGA